MAIVRLIVWFIIFHVGIDFWIFPNYFIDSNNPLDSFIPLLEVSKRDDIFDFRMLILRLASIATIVYGATVFMQEPKSIDDVLSTFSELQNDVFEWGQNKFLGIPDNSQAIQQKKSAREIFAEAFMEDETFRTNTQFVKYADEEELKAAYEKEMKAKKAAAESNEEEQTVEIEEDLLDQLTLFDDEESAEVQADAITTEGSDEAEES